MPNPNLVGIGNSQVPTNAMLGDLAYQDSVGEINFEKIKARANDTAKDIFVYDTSKDSDGGAWRKKTQDTSWYNEDASSTRGARKEFPAVAIIVVEAYQVTIYDADDSNCPMWMVFNQSTTDLGAMVGYSNMTIGCCTMLNGILMVGLDHTAQGNVAGLRLINFISEHHHWKANITGRHSSQHWPIVDRNGGRPGVNVDSNVIVNEVINDVDAIVLPNASVDSKTGLPNPTIVIGTNGGISVITDSGVVYDLTTNNEADDIAEIAFLSDNRYSFATTANNTRWWVDDIQTADENHNYFYQRTSYDYSQSNQANMSAIGRVNGTSRGELGEAVFRGTSGMGRIRYIDSLLNFTASDYNTGWQLANNRAIFLCDTDATNLTGTEYVTNGNFNNGLTGWTSQVNTGGSITVNGSTQAVITSQDASNRTELQQTVVVPKGVDLIYSFDLVSGSIYNGGAASNNLSSGTHSWVWNISGTGNQTINLWFTPPGWSGSGTIDNISIRTADHDRSRYGGFNDNIATQTEKEGLEAWGTINKSPVATGAELVGYNFPATTSYFQQPYNSNIGNVGSGDFSIMGWFYNTPQGVTFFDIASAASPRFFVSQMYNSDNFWFYMNTGSGGASWTTGGGGIEGKAYWQFIAVKRVGTTFSYSFNGKDFVSQTDNAWGGSISGSVGTNRVTIGQNYTHGSAHFGTTGQMALWKFSAHAPTIEQIRKIYNDEKRLFNENAKCTLYGTTDSVRALAYDDSNNIIHAGTASGRSEFQGINRINNTTTEVTHAISASNGLVAEQ